MSTEGAPLMMEGVVEDEDDVQLQQQTPIHLAKGDDILFDDEHVSSGQESGASSPELTDEEAIFTLLFQQCDTEGTGEVGVEQLISYIRKVRLGQQHGEKEEVYDSQEDFPKMQYNLHLLKAMLECNSTDDGKVDQPTYSHIIRMWVKDVRERDKSEQSAASEQLEVSQLSDSPDNLDGGAPEQEVSYGSYVAGGGDESHESFETSGALSTSRSEHDRIDLINSVADLKLDNKRLQDMNKALQLQMEHSEENLKEIQTENKELKRQIRDFQANLTQLEQLEGDNTELTAAFKSEKRKCQELVANTEKLGQEVANLQEDLKLARSQLSAFELEKNQLMEEGSTLKDLLLQKEELLSHQETTCVQMEAQLQLETQRVKELSQTLDEVKLTRDELRSENSDLQTQIRLSRVRGKQPLSSTPYRPNAPSWHEELMEQESITSRSSPILPRRDDTHGVLNGVSGVNGKVKGEEEGVVEELSASDSFSKILEETDVKINQKTNQLVRELSDLINQPSPTSSRHTVVENNSRMVIQEKVNDRSMQSFESKLAELLRKKKKVEKENSRLAAQVEELKKRLEELEKVKVVNGTASPSREDGVGTGVNGERVPVQEHATAEFHHDHDLDASTSFMLPASSAPPTQVRLRPTLSRSLVVHHDFNGSSGTTSGNTDPFSISPASLPLVEKSQQTDPSVISGDIEELALQNTSALRGSENKEFAELRRRHNELTARCTQLQQQRAEDVKRLKPGWLSYIGGSVYRILKTMVLLLMVIFFLLFITFLYVALMDLLSRCGSHCPHSPAYVFYAKLGSYLQYTRTASPI